MPTQVRDVYITIKHSTDSCVLPVNVQPSTTISPLKKPRDGRLDVLRGLCLANMVIVHLLDQGLHMPWIASEIIMHWVRFAAGGFVMTSGLCIGAIHFNRALDPAKRASTYVSLLKRSGLVLLVHYFATFLSLLLIPIHGQEVANVGKMAHDVLVFYTGYDLLLFYVFMLLISPVIIELVRRVGARWVLLASVAIFFWHYDNPYLHLWACEKDFPLVRWQLIFVIGLLQGSKLKRYDAMSSVAKWRLMYGFIAAAFCIAALSAVERLGLVHAPWYLAVTKMPLSILEVAHYVALATALGILVDRYWSQLGGTKLEAVLKVVGVQSLMLWVVHVPIVANAATLRWTVAIPLSLLAVWLAAVIGTWLGKQWSATVSNLPKLGYLVPVVGSVAVMVTLAHLEAPPHAIAVVPTETLSTQAAFGETADNDLPIPIDDDSVSDAA